VGAWWEGGWFGPILKKKESNFPSFSGGRVDVYRGYFSGKVTSRRVQGQIDGSREKK